jgi:hypothetical protein
MENVQDVSASTNPTAPTVTAVYYCDNTRDGNGGAIDHYWALYGDRSWKWTPLCFRPISQVDTRLCPDHGGHL